MNYGKENAHFCMGLDTVIIKVFSSKFHWMFLRLISMSQKIQTVMYYTKKKTQNFKMDFSKIGEYLLNLLGYQWSILKWWWLGKSMQANLWEVLAFFRECGNLVIQ